LNNATFKKGDALAVARIAGIQAAKLTSTLIPLAHPGLPLGGVEVAINVFPPFSRKATPDGGAIHMGYEHGAARIMTTVSVEGKTGVEMEALVAANVAGLALYDMLKGLDKGMLLTGGRVLRKQGGKSGGWRWDGRLREVVKDDEEAKGSDAS
jgi:molybdenum cofactor biosynthesis protein MoaC